MIIPTWQYKTIDLVDDLIPNGSETFLYKISCTNGMKYVGKKNMISTRRVPVKGRKNKKIVKSDSKWRDYWGSCVPLLDDITIHGYGSYTREILEFYPNKQEVNYAELAYQVIFNVLDDSMWYNANINLKFYPSAKYGDVRIQHTHKWINESISYHQ